LVNDKKIEGISDLRDESDRDGIRVVVEVKKDFLPEIVLNNLFSKTDLQVNFPGNLVALTCNGTVPSRLSLKTVLQSFIDFR
jgi:DNA gyrase subunit A